MISHTSSLARFPSALLLTIVIVSMLSAAACDSEISADPRTLLLAPEDFGNGAVSVTSSYEQESLDGPSALVELEGPDFRVLQSLVIFESREGALAALDAIRADLVSRGETGPGEREASGVFNDRIGNEDAAGLFFIEQNGLVRLAVSGIDRDRRLSELANLARSKLSDG